MMAAVLLENQGRKWCLFLVGFSFQVERDAAESVGAELILPVSLFLVPLVCRKNQANS